MKRYHDISQRFDDVKSWAASKPPAQYKKPETGFVENWESALNHFFYEETSVGRWAIQDEYFKRMDTLHKMIESGEIPGYVAEANRNMNPDKAGVFNYDGLAAYARGVLGKEDIPFDNEIEDRIREDLKVMRGAYNDVTARSSGMGVAGSMLGGMHAVMLDPITWPSMFIGVGQASAAVTSLGAFARGAAITGLAEGAVETIRQPFIYKWKQDIGVNYSVKEALANIVLTAGGASLLGGLSGVAARRVKMSELGDLLEALLRKKGLPDDQAAKQAKKIVKNMVRDAKTTPNPEQPIEEFYGSVRDEAVRQETRGAHGGQDVDQSLDSTMVDENYSKFEAENPDPKLATGNVKVDETGHLQVETKPMKEIIEESTNRISVFQKIKECLLGG